jgi:hypothetical protein
MSHFKVHQLQHQYRSEKRVHIRVKCVTAAAAACVAQHRDREKKEQKPCWLSNLIYVHCMKLHALCV